MMLCEFQVGGRPLVISAEYCLSRCLFRQTGAHQYPFQPRLGPIAVRRGPISAFGARREALKGLPVRVDVRLFGGMAQNARSGGGPPSRKFARVAKRP